MNQTLAILKPDCVQGKLIGKAIDFIESKGFTIKGIKMVKLDKKMAEKFYSVHTERPFFNNLIEFITSGACIAMVLEKENAVEELRRVIGATDPEKAEENTLRRIYGADIQKNVIHGSDSEENAKKEIAFFFSLIEIIN